MVAGPAGTGFVDNYAVAGTFAADYDLGGGVVISNLADFLSLLGGGPVGGIPGLSQQAAAYAGTGIDASATHVVWAGANDLLYAPLLRPGLAAAPAAAVEAFADNVAAAVFGVLTGLEAAGAMETVVFNLPDLGATPLADGLSTIDPAVGAALLGVFGGDSVALSVFLSGLTTFFNHELEALLAAAGLSTRLFDAEALVASAAADPAAFGFTNTTDSCLSALSPVPTVCPNPDEYIYWDDVHPTSAAHQTLGQRSLAVIAVPEPGALALFLVGLAAAYRALCRDGRRG